ncbi:GH1 family beta-glucosidase [Mucilaginibacter sp. X5P1]|uniref:GH1 family beta-glucosidase n=1 Tax=Mucilaginibacter sp. X5P1 TaxID=2723088 RepID=UPI00161BBDE1|nr:GH1 family beta-glucosidase [Mucilaginibacter sp. X5P1]MBB6137430.1 beta-glucosidase [Mucilaginibacter sp. X5P1]
MELTTQTSDFNKELFGDDFTWGVATAAFQIEGAYDHEGKGQSIWDVFSAKKGNILNGHKPGDACDFYNRYEADIDLIKQLNIPNFRFSISWSRVFPEGIGSVNQAGIDYYNRVIDYCIKQGVTPWVTLYHWDLPHALELKGGWTNREIVTWFTEFVIVCAKNFGDRVKNWMIMNEPSVFTGAGYFLGIHAPGRKGLGNFMPAVHHAVLCMAAGGRTLRSILPDAQIGTTFSCSYIEPASDKPRDVMAAKRVDTLLNRVYIEPTLGLGYPVADLPILKKMDKYIQPGDMESAKFDFDFIGIQLYTREIVKYSLLTPYVHASLIGAKKRNVPLTDMGWEVYPPAIYEILKKFNAYTGIKKIYVTENGAAFPDEVKDGKVHDPRRVEYLQNYLKQVLKAKNEGYKVSGYFVWTLTDNFEWAEGYHPRFGLIHVNFDTQQRIIKSSGQWYGGFIKP